MRTKLFSVLAVLSLVACGGNSAPANEPIQTSTPTSSTSSGISGTSGPASPGDPSGAAPSVGDSKPTSGAPASPIEGGCKSGSAPATATDLASCEKGCQGMDNTVPPGSRCIPAKVSCMSQCKQKFQKP